MDNFPGILVALAPFALLFAYLVFAFRRSSQSSREFVTFGRQSADHSQQILAELRTNNALLTRIADRLEHRETTRSN